MLGLAAPRTQKNTIALLNFFQGLLSADGFMGAVRLQFHDSYVIYIENSFNRYPAKQNDFSHWIEPE